MDNTSDFEKNLVKDIEYELYDFFDFFDINYEKIASIYSLGDSYNIDINSKRTLVGKIRSGKGYMNSSKFKKTKTKGLSRLSETNVLFHLKDMIEFIHSNRDKYDIFNYENIKNPEDIEQISQFSAMVSNLYVHFKKSPGLIDDDDNISGVKAGFTLDPIKPLEPKPNIDTLNKPDTATATTPATTPATKPSAVEPEEPDDGEIDDLFFK